MVDPAAGGPVTEYEYNVIYRKIIPQGINTPFVPATDLLNEAVAGGWRLVTVVAYPAVFEQAVYEVFYLEREKQ